ncbi:MAG: hypothetical protein ACI825_001897 [Planctomycetota bacterium]|jgi:hypothetical protein
MYKESIAVKIRKIFADKITNKAPYTLSREWCAPHLLRDLILGAYVQSN